jgi:hypothetical protein
VIGRADTAAPGAHDAAAGHVPVFAQGRREG